LHKKRINITINGEKNMKKTTVLFLLIMLLGILAADVYTIGDGTSTTNYVPLYGLL
jgi:hypothetical protein